MAFYDDVHTSKKFRLGTEKHDTSGRVFKYLQGVASTAVGSWVNFDGATDFTTALLDTDVAATQLGRLAVAMAAVGASQYGWYAVEGTVPALSLTGATDGKNCFSVSTAGSVDDSGAGAEVLVFGAFYVGAVDETTLLANVTLNRPFMTGLTLD